MPNNQPVTGSVLVQLENVHKDYLRGSRIVSALRGVNLTVQAGSFVVIEGLSGSGKSTLLNLIGCLDHPTSGRVLIGGQDAHAMSDQVLSQFRADRLGFVFQHFNLIPVLTAYENVEYPLRLKGIHPAGLRRRIDEVLNAVGMLEAAGHNDPGSFLAANASGWRLRGHW